jgi:hypothetical protein
MSQTKLTVEQLTAVEALIKKGWTQKAYARLSPESLFDCDPTELEAACYCLVGATAAVIYPGMKSSLDAIADAIDLTNNTFTPYTYMHTPVWNDMHHRTQADVLSLIAQVKADLILKQESVT